LQLSLAGVAERLVDELNSQAFAVPLDMTKPDEIRASTQSLISDFGRIDAAVFNGGVARANYFIDSSEDDWFYEMQVNFFGPLLMTKLCLPGMISNGRGVFVGITSESAKVGDVGHAVYAASKAALSAFFKSMVREYGRKGITANAVAPGPIDTPMLRYTYGSEAAATEGIAKLIRQVPLARLGMTEEVAAAVRFLCSEAGFVAGEHLSVGGGVTMNA
jgi:2-hydroxycyclohexanecarboxyl-CoA dehydrogenase